MVRTTASPAVVPEPIAEVETSVVQEVIPEVEII